VNNNLSTLKQRLHHFGIHLSKQRGQSLLVDETVLDDIVIACELGQEDVVLEIGAGTGVLTAALAKRVNQVYAIEVDKRMFQLLTDNLRGYNNITLLQEDILNYNFFELMKAYPENPIKIIGNLPYSITTPILMKVIEGGIPFISAMFMIQKEVAERLVAKPATKEYGILTIAVAYHGQVEIVRNVPAKSFFPVPEVDSAVIKLVPHQKPPAQVDDEKFFFRIVKVAFSQRRKTLLNTLSTISHQLGLNKSELEQILSKSGIDAQRRGETLSIAEFAKLANLLKPLVLADNKSD
jgi:16S rRNA (adenine1518-N6/adenine1519-N6)-dimethyltransferase